MKFTILALLFLSAMGFAETAPVLETTPLTDDQAFQLVLQLIGGLSGAGTMALVLVLVQVLFVAMRSRLGEKTGFWRLTILSGLALVLGLGGLLANGLPLTSALLHASMLPLIQNFVAQVVIQLRKRGEDKAISLK